jgi:hypothetical protein
MAGAIADITAETVAQAFVSTWVAQFGTPVTVTTDQGRQFESNLWKSLTQLLGTKHLRTTAYHPCAYGLVECLHKQLKAPLKGHPQQLNWTVLFLPWIQTALKDDLSCTASEMVYGTTLCLPAVSSLHKFLALALTLRAM